MENTLSTKLNTLVDEKKVRELNILLSKIPSFEQLLQDKPFVEGFGKAVNSRLSNGNTLSIMLAITNMQILQELKNLNENLSNMFVEETSEVVEEEKKKKK